MKIAFEKYGYSPLHRFGMSDDDPENIEFMEKEMEELKREYPKNSFSIIETKDGTPVKREVLVAREVKRKNEDSSQTSLI